jgi:hypothetical protein
VDSSEGATASMLSGLKEEILCSLLIVERIVMGKENFVLGTLICAEQVSFI